MRGLLVVMGLVLVGPAWGQGFSMPSMPSLPGAPSAPSGAGVAGAAQGQLTQQTPEQRRAFCGRVASAAAQCGLGIGATALTACVVRALPTEDSLRVARVAGSASGDASSVMRECGVALR